MVVWPKTGEKHVVRRGVRGEGCRGVRGRNRYWWVIRGFGGEYVGGGGGGGGGDSGKLGGYLDD